MRAKTINETLSQTEKREQNQKQLKNISSLIKTDLSVEMNQILDLLDREEIVITEVDPTIYTRGGERDNLIMWISFESPYRDGGEEFNFIQNPIMQPNSKKRRLFQRKRARDSWDHDPWESKHNKNFVNKILSEMIYQHRTSVDNPNRIKFSKEDFRKLDDELKFLREK